MEVFKERDYFIENEEPRPWILNAGEGWVEKYDPEPNTVCISITEPLEPGNILKRQHPAKLRSGWVDILRLEFQDYDPIKLIPGSDLINPQVKIPENAVLYTSTQAARVSRFLRKHRGKNIVVHCAAGVSRSAGIVVAALEAFPEYEDKGWIRHPNNHVRTLTKRALGLVPIGYEEPVESTDDQADGVK